VKLLPLLILTLSIFNSNAQVWTLEQCIDTAIQNNLTLQKSAVTTQIANVTLRNSKQNLLPSVNAGGTHGYNWGQTIDPFTNQFATNRVQYDNLSLSSSFTLFSGLQNYHTIKANSFASQQSEVNQQIAERNLKIDVSSAYLQVLLNEEILNLSKDNQHKTQEQLQRMQELLAVKQATTFDLSEIEAQLNLDNYQLTKSGNDLSYSKLILQQILNIPYADSFEINSSMLDSSQFNHLILTDSTINKLPEIISLELGVKKQMMLIKSQKGRYYPSLLVSGSMGSGYSGNNKMLETNGSYVPKPFGRQLGENFYQSAQLILSVPIFNKNANRNQVKIAEYQLQSLYLDKQNQANTLKQKLEQISMDIINESEQYNALKSVYESALINYTNFQTRYENSDVTFTQLVEAKNKLYNATSKLYQSNYQLLFKETVMSFYYDDLH